MDGEDIMRRSLGFLTNLPSEPQNKLDHLFRQVEVDEPTGMSYDLAEKVTMRVMQIKGFSDDLFLHWMHFMGYYIKARYGGKWYLRHYVYPGKEATYYPCVITDDGRLWNVGEYCWKTYYVKGKLGGIGFSLFYKLYVEQILGPLLASDYLETIFQPLE